MKAQKNTTRVHAGVIFFISLFTIVSCNNATQFDVQESANVEATDVSPANLDPCPPICDFSVSIDGANRLYLSEGDTYTADINGGDSPYLYLWNYTLLNCTGGDCSDEGVRQFGSTNSSFFFANNYDNYDDVKFEVWVEDDNHDEGYASKTVDLEPITP